MPAPYPANNPTYTGSLFPNAVDEIAGEKEMADAIMATQATVLGAPGAPPLASTSAGTVTATTSLTVGTAVLRGGSGAPATGLGNVGDFYFRTDTPGTANQRIYIKTAAATWTALIV